MSLDTKLSSLNEELAELKWLERRLKQKLFHVDLKVQRAFPDTVGHCFPWASEQERRRINKKMKQVAEDIYKGLTTRASRFAEANALRKELAKDLPNRLEIVQSEKYDVLQKIITLKIQIYDERG